MIRLNMHRQIVHVQCAVIVYILSNGIQNPDPDIGKIVFRMHECITLGSIKRFAIVAETDGDLAVLYKKLDVNTVRFAIIKTGVNNDDGHFFKRQPHMIASGAVNPFPLAVGDDLFRNIDCIFPAGEGREKFVS